jgi:hypothetical protein
VSVAAIGRSSTLRRSIVVACLAALALGGVTALQATRASAVTRADALKSAATYARKHGYRVGITVYDTKYNRTYTAGYARSTFASESVVKAMIATRLILQGRMHGTTAKRAYKMITQSDDAIASSFYGSVGGDSLINFIKKHYHVPNLGSPPRRAGWWGNTHITAIGLARWYAKIKKDKKVGPWLINAMHHAKKYGSDGTYQFFGLPSATSGAAVKQGWGTDYDDWGRSADFNTTGFVDNNRYTVAILARGPARTYGSAIGSLLTAVAKRVLPGGRFPDAAPAVVSRTHYTGPTTGGQQIRIDGRDFTHVSKVMFGGYTGTHLKVVSSTRLYITTPAHPAMKVPVRIYTDHGVGTARGVYEFVPPPVVTSISPSSGTAAGGQTVTITGKNLNRLMWTVRFGGHLATDLKVLSSTRLQVRTPAAGAAGPTTVLVHSFYGWSSSPVKYTYTPKATGVKDNGDGTATISGYGLTGVDAVEVGGNTWPIVSRAASSLRVQTAPESGPIAMQLQSKYGSSTITYTPAS